MVVLQNQNADSGAWILKNWEMFKINGGSHKKMGK